MIIETIKKGPFQIMRLSSGSIGETDAIAIKTSIEESLKSDIRNFIFSTPPGSPSCRVVLFNLLMLCKKILDSKNGRLLFLEISTDGRKVYHCVCEALRIPYYIKRLSPECSSARPPN